MHKRCPKCRRRFDNRGYRNHVKKCNVNAIHKNAQTNTEGIENKNFNEDGDTFCVTPGGIFPGVRGHDSIKVRDFFLSHPGIEFTPKRIALLAKISHGSAKMVCWRFFKKSFIDRPLKNHYAYNPKISTEELEELQNELGHTLHNFTLIFPKNQGNTSGGSTNQVTLPFDTKDEVEINKTISTLNDFNGDVLAKITTIVYERIDIIYIKCSENPLDEINLGRVLGILEERGYNWKDLFWINAEFNIDVPAVKIMGAKCVEYRPF